jgi:hypothetical protein
MNTTQVSLGPDGFGRLTTTWNYPFDAGVSEARCQLPYDCAEWGPELAAVRAALEGADVEQALAASPVLYGTDARGLDASLLRIAVGEKLIDIGVDCLLDDVGCVNAPAGVQALRNALAKLERRAALGCFPECLPQPRVLKPSCSQADLFVWTGYGCEQIMPGSDPAGLDCGGPLYNTDIDCSQAHAHCWDLVGPLCGAQAGNTCDADDYCAYQSGQVCGATDAQAVCVPKPRSCPQPYAPVCGCDARAYDNACLAAMAGEGINTPTSCTVSGACVTDGDCSPLAQTCYEQGGSGVISLQPFCMDSACQCLCGYRDGQGTFVPAHCD